MGKWYRFRLDLGADHHAVLHIGGHDGAGKRWRFGLGEHQYGEIGVYVNQEREEGEGNDGESSCRVALACTVPITETVFFQATGLYTHGSELPGMLDGDEFQVGARLGWQGERWGVSVGGARSLGSQDVREWSAEAALSGTW